MKASCTRFKERAEKKKSFSLHGPLSLFLVSSRTEKEFGLNRKIKEEEERPTGENVCFSGGKLCVTNPALL